MEATDDPVTRLTKWVAHDTAMRPRRRDNLGDSYETVPLKRSDIAAVLDELKQLRTQAIGEHYTLSHGGAYCHCCRKPMREGAPVIRTTAALCTDCGAEGIAS